MNTAFILCASILILDTVAQKQPLAWEGALPQVQHIKSPQTVVITSNKENSLKFLKVIHGKNEIKTFLDKNPISYQVLGPPDPDLPQSTGQVGQLKVMRVISGKANVIKYLQDNGHSIPSQLQPLGGYPQNRPVVGLPITYQGPTPVNNQNQPLEQTPSAKAVQRKPNEKKPTLQRLGSFSSVQEILGHTNANHKFPGYTNDVQHMPNSDAQVNVQLQKPNKAMYPWSLGTIGGGEAGGGGGGMATLVEQVLANKKQSSLQTKPQEDSLIRPVDTYSPFTSAELMEPKPKVGGGKLTSSVEQLVANQKLGQFEPSEESNQKVPAPIAQEDGLSRPMFAEAIPIEWSSNGLENIPVTNKPTTIPVVWPSSRPVDIPVTRKPPSNNMQPMLGGELISFANEQNVAPEPLSLEGWLVPGQQSNYNDQQNFNHMPFVMQNNIAEPENSDRPTTISVDEQTGKVTFSEANTVGTKPYQESSLFRLSNPTPDFGPPIRVLGLNKLIEKPPTGLAEIIDLPVPKKKRTNLDYDELTTFSDHVAAGEILGQRPQHQITSQIGSGASLQDDSIMPIALSEETEDLEISADNKPMPISFINNEADYFIHPTLEHPVSISEGIDGGVSILDVVDGKVDDVELNNEGGDEDQEGIKGDGLIDGFIDNDGVILYEVGDTNRLPGPRRNSDDYYIEDGFFDPSGINLLSQSGRNSNGNFPS